MNNYYVYGYFRQKDDLPYYIGKGKNGRAWSKNHGRVSVPKDASKIKILYENLSELEAHKIEKDLIKHYGRKNIGTGILLNQTEGGEGSSGRVLSESSISKFRNITKQKHNESAYGFSLGHASKAGQIGGKSKSPAKVKASLSNLEKASSKGTKWMWDPTTQTYHRVKLEFISNKIELGWIFKHRPAWNKGQKKDQ